MTEDEVDPHTGYEAAIRTHIADGIAAAAAVIYSDAQAAIATQVAVESERYAMQYLALTDAMGYRAGDAELSPEEYAADLCRRANEAERCVAAVLSVPPYRWVGGSDQWGNPCPTKVPTTRDDYVAAIRGEDAIRPSGTLSPLNPDAQSAACQIKRPA